MTKKFYKIAAVILIVIYAVSGVSVFAKSSDEQMPYQSYTYWTDIGTERKSVYNRAMYRTEQQLDYIGIGVAGFNSLMDVNTDKNGNVYILDDKSRIVVMDKKYSLLYEISEIKSGSDYLNYDGAQSIYIHTDGTVFICDTENKRILHTDRNGNLIDMYELPDSPLIPDDFDFRPLKIVVDSHNYCYVLSEGSYYGALLYDPNKNFVGFYGANDVTTNIAGKLKNMINRIFINNVKKSASERVLPYCFADIVIDSKDFLYTATGKTEQYDRKDQIKKLNPGTGDNILKSRNVIFTDDKINTTLNVDQSADQDICGLFVDDDGFIYALDSCYGRIFMYDKDGRMLTAFGGGLGKGENKGAFISANSIAVNGDDVLVTDKSNNTLTVFKITEYGKKVKECLILTGKGEYIKAKPLLEEILKEDNSFQPAYMALARAEIDNGNYKYAMELAKKGYDRDTYAIAFEMHRKEFLKDNFQILFMIAAVILTVIIVYAVYVKRRNFGAGKFAGYKLLLSASIHPVKTFDVMKEKGEGSVLLCMLQIALFYITNVIQVIHGGFLFTLYDPAEFNSLFVLVRSVGFVVMFIICNWMICTLMQGKGKLREICIVTCYSLTPLIVLRLISLVLTNVLLPNEAVFLGLLEVFAILYTFILLAIGLIRIHDFSFSKFLGTTFLSVLWLAGLVLLMILVYMLLQRFAGFLITVLVELRL